MARETWHARAACRGADARQFSPVTGRGRVMLGAAKVVAERLCRFCPVRVECLGEALHHLPQELVQAGMWWPAENATDRTPIDLLALAHPVAEVAQVDGSASAA